MRLNRPLAVITIASAALVCFAPLSWALGKEEGGRTIGVQLSNIIKQPPELQKYLNQNRKNPRDLTESELQIVTEFASVGSTGDKLICTAFRSAKYSKSQVSAVRERATSACFVASLANGEIEASTQLKTTKISSMAGKILLTLRLNSKMVTTVRPTPAPTQTVTPIPSPTQTVTPIPTPTPTVRPTPSPAPTTTPIPNPTPKPDASRVVSEAQREVWRQLIVAFGLQVDSLVDIITKLEASRVPEQNKLDVAIQYGDTLREGIQKDVIASIDAKIASWTSDKIFYESLIKTYQTKIEDSLKGPVSAGPNRAQIDSWMRLITLHQSSISWNDSQISSTKAELKKYASWRSVAVRYGDERRVNEIDAMISDANLQIAKLQASNSEYNALIAELRLKIAG